MAHNNQQRGRPNILPYHIPGHDNAVRRGPAHGNTPTVLLNPNICNTSVGTAPPAGGGNRPSPPRLIVPTPTQPLSIHPQTYNAPLHAQQHSPHPGNDPATVHTQSQGHGVVNWNDGSRSSTPIDIVLHNASPTLEQRPDPYPFQHQHQQHNANDAGSYHHNNDASSYQNPHDVSSYNHHHHHHHQHNNDPGSYQSPTNRPRDGCYLNFNTSAFTQLRAERANLRPSSPSSVDDEHALHSNTTTPYSPPPSQFPSPSNSFYLGQEFPELGATSPSLTSSDDLAACLRSQDAGCFYRQEDASQQHTPMFAHPTSSPQRIFVQPMGSSMYLQPQGARIPITPQGDQQGQNVDIWNAQSVQPHIFPGGTYSPAQRAHAESEKPGHDPGNEPPDMRSRPSGMRRSLSNTSGVRHPYLTGPHYQVVGAPSDVHNTGYRPGGVAGPGHYLSPRNVGLSGSGSHTADYPQASLLGQAVLEPHYSHPTLEVYNPKQREISFMKFIAAEINQPLLNHLRSAGGLESLMNAFRTNQGLPYDDADTLKISRQFKPSVGTAPNRTDRDKQRISETKAECPIDGCTGNFTRATGLKNHLEAHFELKPKFCQACKKDFRTSSFQRHVKAHKKEAASGSQATRPS